MKIHGRVSQIALQMSINQSNFCENTMFARVRNSPWKGWQGDDWSLAQNSTASRSEASCGRVI